MADLREPTPKDKSTQDFIKDYLENGGEISKCKNHYDPSNNNAIRLKGKVDRYSRSYAERNKQDMNVNSNDIVIPVKTETVRIDGIDIIVEK